MMILRGKGNLVTFVEILKIAKLSLLFLKMLCNRKKKYQN
jgi:hypothetical protein